MDKKRIFIALPISPEITAKIREFANQHSDLPVRWLADKNLHITLVPPQELTETQYQRLKQQLETVSSTPFEVKFTDLSAGPNILKPRMFWVAGQASPEIENLKSDIEQAIGYHPDRPFRMHITLARFSPDAWQENEQLRRLSAPVHWNLLVKKFVIMQSKLTNQNAEYKILHEFPLTN